MKPTNSTWIAVNHSAPIAATAVLGLGLFALLSVPAHADVTVSLDTFEAFPSLSEFQPFNPHDGATPTGGERTLSGVRNLTQSFQLNTAVSLDEIDILFVRGNSGNTGRLRIFDVADTLALDLTADSANTSLLDIQFTMPAGLDPLDNTQQTLTLSLTGPDAITLPATTGPAGYALSLSVPDGVANVFTWRFGDPGTGGGNGWYADGRVFYDDFISSGTTEGRRDGLFALNPVPEPASLSLLGLGLAGLALRLRRKR